MGGTGEEKLQEASRTPTVGWVVPPGAEEPETRGGGGVRRENMEPGHRMTEGVSTTIWRPSFWTVLCM